MHIIIRWRSLCFHWWRSACQHLRIARGVGAQVYVLQQWQDCPYNSHGQNTRTGLSFDQQGQPPVSYGLTGLSYGVGRPGVLVMWVPRGILLLLVLWRTSMCKCTTEGLTYRCVGRVYWATNHNWVSTCGMKNNSFSTKKCILRIEGKIFWSQDFVFPFLYTLKYLFSEKN